MDLLGVLAAVVAIITAAATAFYQWRRAGVEVRRQQFVELVGTVEALGVRLVALRAELAEAKIEIVELRAENLALRKRVSELERENQQLRQRVEE